MFNNQFSILNLQIRKLAITLLPKIFFQNMLDKNDIELATYSPLYRTSSLMIILLCGLTIISIGFYLLFFDLNTHGPSRFSDPNSGKVVINGWVAINMGTGISVFPIYNLVKQYFERKNLSKKIPI